MECPQCAQQATQTKKTQILPVLERRTNTTIEVAVPVSVWTCPCGFEWTDGEMELIRDAAVQRVLISE